MKRRAHFIKIYKKLGLPETASLTDLRQRYHHLASLYHPDKTAQGGTSTTNIELFQETHAAYRELKSYYKTHGYLPLSPQQTVIFPTSKTITAKVHFPRHSRWPFAFLATLAIALIFIVFFMPNKNQTITATPQDAPGHSEFHYLPDNQSQISSQPTNSTPSIKTSGKPLKLGMSMGETFELLGIPDATVGEQWFYGDSEVYFSDGRVSGWNNNPISPINTDPNLPQRYIPTHSQH